MIALAVFWWTDHHGYATGAYCISYGLLRHVLQPYRHEPDAEREFCRVLSYQQLLTTAFYAFGLYTVVIAVVQPVPITAKLDSFHLRELAWVLPYATVTSLLVFLAYGIHYRKVGQWF